MVDTKKLLEQAQAYDKSRGVTAADPVKTAQNASGGVDTAKMLAEAAAYDAEKGKQTRVALPLPSVGVSPAAVAKANFSGSRPTTYEPTAAERILNTAAAAARSTAASVVNTLGTLSDASGSSEAAKKRMGATTHADAERATMQMPAASGQRSTAELYDTADRLQQQSAQNVQTAKQGLGKVGSFAVDTGVALAQLGGDIAAGALTGGGALAPMAVRAFGSGAQEARQSGATLGQQVAYGAGSAALSVATEKIANVSTLMQKAFGKSTLASAIVNRFGSNGIVRAISAATSRLQQTAAGRLALSALSEGGEEFVEAWAQPVLQRATYDKDASFDLGQALYDAAIGGTIGLFGGGVDVVASMARNAAPNAAQARTGASEGNLTGEAQNAAQGATEGAQNAAAANNDAEQSEFDRIRIKTAEEEAADAASAPAEQNDGLGGADGKNAAAGERAEQVARELNLGPVQPEESDAKGMYGYGTTDQNKQAELRRAEEIAKRFDAKFQAMPIGNGAEGEYSNGTITVDPNAKSPVMTVLVHELTHHMETSGLYGQFSERVLNYVAEDMGADLGELRGKVIATYADGGIALDEDGATREIVAKFAEEKLFTDESAIRRFLENDRNLFERIYDWLRDAVTRLTSTPEANFLLSAEKLYAKALADAGGRTDGGAQYSIKRTSGMTLAEQLKAFYDGKLASSDAFYFGETPVSLETAGLDQLPLALTTSDFKKSAKEKHNVPRRVWNNLQRDLETAPFAFEDGDRIGFMTSDIDGDGKPLLIAIQKNVQMDAERVNAVRSAYGLDNPKEWLKNQLNSGKEFVLLDEERANAILYPYGYLASRKDGIRSMDGTVSQTAENSKRKFSSSEDGDLSSKYPKLDLNENISELDGVPAVELKDGSILPIPYHPSRGNRYTHVEFIEKSKIDVDDIKSGGWIGNGVYEPSFTSDTARYIERQSARKRVAELTGKPYRQFSENAYGPKLSELMAMPGINTEANRRSGQSEFDRIRIKTAEEEAAEAEAAERAERAELAAEREANRQARKMTDTDYAQQRKDLDELWEDWGKEAVMTREAPEKADTADLVTAEVKKEEKSLKESVKDLGATLRRKWIDSGDAVREIGKAAGDGTLYAYFNAARASSNAALNMITTAQTNVKGETVGKGLNEIFEPIRAKGSDYYNLFQTYLFHRHNVDRMSRYSQESVDKAEAAMQTFKTENPELLMYEQYQLEEMARDEWSDYNAEAKEYLRLLRELRRAENTKNKPVFGFGWGAEESRAEADKLLREHPEFDKLSEDVYAYTRNLMQYRADSGLITEEQKNYIESIYPHYVPTFRWTENMPLQMNERAVQIGSTIKQARGGDQKLVPLHKALADQTMSVVREGSKNRFGQGLLRAERSKMEGAKKHLRHVEEAEDGFSADTFDDTKDDFSKVTNTFTVRSGGKRYDITVSEDLYEGIKALTPEQMSNNRFLKGARRANDLFKKLCTSMSPTFMIRNPIKDLQDAGLYSKDARAFAAQFPRAAREISTNGAYWQRYKALGGTYTSFFDYETGDVGKRGKLAEKTVGRIEALNNAIEQAPRLAEFMATVKKAGGLENASMDTLMQAMHNAADVTVNFGRSGTIARTVNRYVPFFNAGMQGLSKNVRLFTETKGAKEWVKLATKCVILGVMPRLANELLFGDRDDWDEIKDEAKDQNYLFPIGEGKWLKIPKGRALSTFGLLGNAAANAMSGEEIDARYILSTAADNLAPANPLKNNIFAAAMDSDLFDPSSPGTTWYGGDIESQRLQNYAPEERYDAKTDELSKFLGKTLGLSPKKINYILDQYTGFAGDVILPMMTTAAETSPFVNAFVINSTTNNRLSGDFYDTLDELKFAKNGKDGTGADAVTYRWFNKQSSALSEINAAIREIEADTTLSGEEKKELLEAQYKIRNAAEKSALETLEQYADAAKFYYETATGEGDDRVDDAYLKANREVFGAEYALRVYNKQVYDKAVEVNGDGVAFDDYFDFYFSTRGIEADKDEDGKSISGSKKEKMLAAIDAMDIPNEQKDALYLLEGYSKEAINEAPWRKTEAGLSKLELPKLELPKLELPALELPR